MQKITPFLWFNNNALEAATFYVSIFENSKILEINRNEENGKVFIVAFQIEGQKFLALNGGPVFKFTEAVSFLVDCKNQQEVDSFWERLSKGGKKGQCGWLKDRFGLSWQVVPSILAKLMSDPDTVKSGRVMEAMLKMKKIDIELLKKAYSRR